VVPRDVDLQRHLGLRIEVIAITGQVEQPRVILENRLGLRAQRCDDGSAHANLLS